MPKSILVVLEDPDIAAYLVSLFRTSGYTAHATTEGNDAIEMVEAQKPDVLFLDLALPGRWTPRLYRWIMDNSKYATMPMVLVTDFVGIDLMIPNAVGTVDKPFDPDILLQLVQKALEFQHSIS